MTASNSSGDREPIDQSTNTIQTEFDWTDVEPSTAIIELIAEATDCDPIDLEPLYESVDPDALDRLVRGNGVDPHDQRLSVSFSFDGHAVAVRSSGVVELYEGD